MADGEYANGASMDVEIRILGALAKDNPLLAFSPDVITDAAALDPASPAFQLLLNELTAAKVRVRDWRAAVRARREETCSPAPTYVNGSNGVALHDQHPEDACDPDERPAIKIVPGELPRTVEELCAALVADDAELFQRAGELVTIAREPERRETYGGDRRRGRSIITRPGTPRVRKLPFDALKLRAAKVASWLRFDTKNGWQPSDPCASTIGAFGASPETWFAVPPLRGIIETPFLAPSGCVVDRPGYNEETAYFLLPSCSPGKILDRPTRDHAREALRYLWTEMACDFPFKGMTEPSPNDPDRILQWAKAIEVPDAFIGVAAVLTLLARPAILGAVPGLVFEAASQGSGKSLQMHAVSMIATGRLASTATYPMKDGRPDDQELEKVLGAYALSDASIIAFDNIKGTIGGPAIEQRLTARRESSFRVLGASERRTLPWHALIMFSVNNASMNDDMANRVLVSRVESPREDPRARPRSSFRHPGVSGLELPEALEARRDRLVRAALVVLRSYVAAREAGETTEIEGDTMGSFEAWSKIVPPAIRWAGGPDILRARPEGGSGSDEEAEAHASLLRGWPESWNGQKATLILDHAFKAEREIVQGKAPPDGLDEVRSAIRSLTRTPEGRQPTPHHLGNVLKRLVGKLRGGARLTRTIDGHNKCALWRVDVVAKRPAEPAPPG